jgi:hypothetical protein
VPVGIPPGLKKQGLIPIGIKSSTDESVPVPMANQLAWKIHQIDLLDEQRLL